MLIHLTPPVWTGTTDANGFWYLLWSGFVGAIGVALAVLGLVANAIILYTKHRCHTPGCPWIGRHPDGQWHRCRKHHPLNEPGGVQ